MQIVFVASNYYYYSFKYLHISQYATFFLFMFNVDC